MKKMNPILTLVLIACALVAGWFGRVLLSPAAAPSETSAESTAGGDGPCPGGAPALYWKAPMDPNYIRDEPGKSPMGMDLVPECPGASAEAPEGSVLIDSATMQNIGVRTAPVERRDLARQVRAVGRVAWDERRVAHVHAKISGYIEKLFVDFVGQAVRRGQPLLEIYSPELVATQEELLLAARYRGATGESPFDDVREGGEALFEATRRRLALWDIAEKDIDALLERGEVKRTLTLYAPTSGVITQLGVRQGMEVGPNANLYTVADLSRVWVLADVYEFELPWLAVGQKAILELPYLKGEPIEGKLTYIAPFLDPKTRTAEVRLEVENRSGRLKPEMFGTVVIAGSPRQDVLTIPAEAVIRSGTRTVAVVALGDGRFEPREIEIGLDSGDGLLEVRSGLDDGDEIVVSSQFLIDSESNLKEVARKLMAGRSETSDAGEMDPAEMDHSGHDMPDDADVDHSGHVMPDAPVDEHAGHDAPADMDHSGHDMPADPPDPHAGHAPRDQGGH